MTTFLLQAGVQVVVIALIWIGVARDASRLREVNGQAPAGISPFAWGALCGLTWVALIAYVRARKDGSTATPPVRERNMLRWFIGLALLAAAWSASDVVKDDANNAAQHAILAATFAVCALIAGLRDRAARGATAGPTDPSLAASEEHV